MWLVGIAKIRTRLANETKKNYGSLTTAGSSREGGSSLSFVTIDLGSGMLSFLDMNFYFLQLRDCRSDCDGRFFRCSNN
jgi:hypothetical protein